MKKITFSNLTSIKRLFLLFFLLFLNNSFAQYYTTHYVAPSPWSYFSKANELVVSTESMSNVSITVKKSDGTTPITTLTAKKGTPAVYRFSGDPLTKDYLALNTKLSGEGLIITSSTPISVNLRNVASDNIPGSQDTADQHIKGNASLTSFGNPGLGTNFRIGYYRDGTLGTFWC